MTSSSGSTNKTNRHKWAANHGYQYHTVSNVLRGVNKATFGAGREVAEKLIRL
ncbi:hypothetical protein [Candidatus Aalborgicola defluviihabitans]|uniref:hypothetical protein n=1 Tax=Candidatus Aalborgicola defluviihabitans TaxID=3386187 RepID=UPI001D72FE04|nr:hypothetical protein [Burkholderiales bacterium]